MIVVEAFMLMIIDIMKAQEGSTLDSAAVNIVDSRAMLRILYMGFNIMAATNVIE